MAGCSVAVDLEPLVVSGFFQCTAHSARAVLACSARRVADANHATQDGAVQARVFVAQGLATIWIAKDADLDDSFAVLEIHLPPGS